MKTLTTYINEMLTEQKMHKMFNQVMLVIHYIENSAVYKNEMNSKIFISLKDKLKRFENGDVLLSLDKKEMKFIDAYIDLALNI